MVMVLDSGKMTATFVHDWGCPMADFDVVAPTFKFDEQVGILVGLGRAAVEHAQVVISRTMLADVLVAGAVGAVIVGRQFGKESKHDPFPIHSEDDDCVHLFPSAKLMYRKTIDGY
jgi:hypothetical protein